jgi:AAA+ superfamily predicted ATPase
MNPTPAFESEAAWQQINFEYLTGQLQRVRMLLERRIRWLRHRWGAARGVEFPQGVAISDAAADVLLETETIATTREFLAGDPQAVALDENIRHIEKLLEDASQTMAQAGRPAAFDVLCGLFELNPFERDVVILCAAAEIDPSFARLFAYAQDDVNLRHATIPLALALFSPSDTIAHVVRRCFAPDAPLRRDCLVSMTSEDASPQCLRPIRIDDRLLDYICGNNRIDSRAADLLEPIQAMSIAPEQQIAVEQLAAVLKDSEQRKRYAGVNLFGPSGSGRRAVARQLCGQLGLELLSLNPARMSAASPERQAILRLLGREAVLSHFAVYVRMDETEGSDAAIATEVAERLPTFFIVGSRTRISAHRELLSRKLGTLDVAARTGLWKSTLAAMGASLNGQAEAVAEHFQFGQEMMSKTVSAAWARARMRGHADLAGITDEDVWDACREQSSWELRQLAHPIEPSFTWDDIVLPPEVLAQLREICAQVAYRATVYRKWGFGGKISRGLGISALFSGVSGTGKTMAAEVLARHLRLDLYRVDLAGVVSKYIGETEKNLKKIFDAAERSGAILFFDEADALFGKRTDVKDSHDRFANIEVNYLLQRMENFNGLSILATNRKSDVDRAFLRRLRFLVDFPFPDSIQRMRIWHKSFPVGAPLGELDYDVLARLEIPGGNIRNIALSAAFLAAERKADISMELLIMASKREYTKMEKMIGDSDFERAPGRPAWR